MVLGGRAASKDSERRALGGQRPSPRPVYTHNTLAGIPNRPGGSGSLEAAVNRWVGLINGNNKVD